MIVSQHGGIVPAIPQGALDVVARGRLPISPGAANFQQGAALANQAGLPLSTLPITPGGEFRTPTIGAPLNAPNQSLLGRFTSFLQENQAELMMLGGLLAPEGNPIRAFGTGGANLIANKELGKMQGEIIRAAFQDFAGGGSAPITPTTELSAPGPTGLAQPIGNIAGQRAQGLVPSAPGGNGQVGRLATDRFFKRAPSRPSSLELSARMVESGAAAIVGPSKVLQGLRVTEQALESERSRRKFPLQQRKLEQDLVTNRLRQLDIMSGLLARQASEGRAEDRLLFDTLDAARKVNEGIVRAKLAPLQERTARANADKAEAQAELAIATLPADKRAAILKDEDEKRKAAELNVFGSQGLRNRLSDAHKRILTAIGAESNVLSFNLGDDFSSITTKALSEEQKIAYATAMDREIQGLIDEGIGPVSALRSAWLNSVDLMLQGIDADIEMPAALRTEVENRTQRALTTMRGLDSFQGLSPEDQAQREAELIRQIEGGL